MRDLKVVHLMPCVDPPWSHAHEKLRDLCLVTRGWIVGLSRVNTIFLFFFFFAQFTNHGNQFLEATRFGLAQEIDL